MHTEANHPSAAHHDPRAGRPVVSGKFLHVEGGRFLIRGVSYGTFAPEPDGALFPPAHVVARDFGGIVELGANTVRTYTPPPERVLDEAARCGLRVIAGVPWTQHVAFLESASLARAIRAAVRGDVKRLASHPATLLFTVGNEIPPGVVRWYGRRRIERFLRELVEDAKSAAPDALVTYINYPPTEYLDLPFLDVCAFNVFLHGEAQLGAYLARLHHAAGSRPLLIAEAGADSARNGEQHQAALVAMQLRTAYREGAAGAIVFSWTDEWWRGGRRIDDWKFGLVDAARQPKPAYAAVQRVLRSAAGGDDRPDVWPTVSVVVCAYNAASTLDECLSSLEALRYPAVEIIVVNDGSTDATGAIAARHRTVRVVETANGGLGSARNVGLQYATGDIVAYTDADVRVEPDWLAYLIPQFFDENVVAVGGPNLVPGDDPWMAQCVARAPGGPTHVLLDDRVAEHIPGCNCAFRRHALVAIGGFNPTFVRAGDDVDVCWRLQARGWQIWFAPAALVWHHHRPSLRTYLRQQIGYGEGESWLMREHPEKFVRGRIAWRGTIYSPLPFIRSLSATRIHAGPFGSAAFPSVYRTDAHPFAHLAHSGRWQIAWVTLLAIAALVIKAGEPYGSALLAGAVLAMAATGVRCVLHGLRSDLTGLQAIGRLSTRSSRAVYRSTIAVLHFLQPFARAFGRVRGLMKRSPAAGHQRAASASPVARSGVTAGLRIFSRRHEQVFWSDRWIDGETLLADVADRLRRQRAVRHIELDSGWWEDRDLTVVNRVWFRLDLRALVEDHGQGRCLWRVRMRPRLTSPVVPLVPGAGAALLLHATGVMTWPITAALVGLAGGVFAAGDMALTSSLVSNAIKSLAADRGMLALDRRPATLTRAAETLAPQGPITPGAGPRPERTPRSGKGAAAGPHGASARAAGDKARASRALAGKA